MTSIFQQERPCLTIKRPNCLPTGTYPPPRSASLWISVMKLIRSPSRNTPTPSIYSLIADGVHTARRHWVVIRGKSWLSNRHRCRQIVTKRVLNLRHRVPQQELVSLVTKMIAIRATPEMGLVLQGILMIRTSVETKHNPFRTTEIKKKHIKTIGYGLEQ